MNKNDAFVFPIKFILFWLFLYISMVVVNYFSIVQQFQINLFSIFDS